MVRARAIRGLIVFVGVAIVSASAFAQPALGDCPRGQRKAGKTCVAVVVPEHGEIDYLGHDWTCKRGYRKAGKTCVAVVVPEHGEIDYLGHDWTCKTGFKRRSKKCAPMSADERRAAEQRLAVAIERSRRLSDATCEIDDEPAEGDHAEIVLQKYGCGYVLADGPNGHYLLEWYGGYDPDEGDIVIGPINGYGFKNVCYPGHGEGRIYVDDYLMGKSTAVAKFNDKCP